MKLKVVPFHIIESLCTVPVQPVDKYISKSPAVLYGAYAYNGIQESSSSHISIQSTTKSQEVPESAPTTQFSNLNLVVFALLDQSFHCPSSQVNVLFKLLVH